MWGLTIYGFGLLNTFAYTYWNEGEYFKSVSFGILSIVMMFYMYQSWESSEKINELEDKARQIKR